MRRKRKSEHHNVEFDNATRRQYEPTDRWIVFQVRGLTGRSIWAAKPAKVGVYITLNPLVALATFDTLVEAGDFARTASASKVVVS